MSSTFMAVLRAGQLGGAGGRRRVGSDCTPVSDELKRLDGAFVEGQPAVHAGREGGVVGGDQGGEAGIADEVQQHAEDLVGGMLVEVAGGLVGQQQLRLVGERAGDGDALLLAARELRRPVRRALGQADEAEQARGRPAIICGTTMFSSAENSRSRWWYW
jgi:hypothetical protein